MTLEILFQDPSLVVVNKPAGMLVHPGRDPEPLEQIAMKVLRDQIGHRVFTVHRLDRPTSGVLLFALDTRIETVLRKQFEDQSVEKNYAAIVAGQTPDQWISNTPLKKAEDEPHRSAETEFTQERTSRIGDTTFSHLSVTPRTGRFHQIRKHLAEAEFPIVGDYLYGEIETMDRLAQATGQSRLMLHARSLSFFHPIEGVEMEVQCPLPERFQAFD